MPLRAGCPTSRAAESAYGAAERIAFTSREQCCRTRSPRDGRTVEIEMIAPREAGARSGVENEVPSGRMPRASRIFPE